MAVEQQHWKFTMSAEVVNGDQLLHIHPENFTNLIIVYDYEKTIMPSILAKVNLDKNLLDFIIQNADELEIYLNIKKFTQSIDDQLKTGPEVDFIKGTYLVSVGSDINYNKELDYMTTPPNGLPDEDKFKETYLGLVSKESLDANKIVANEVIHTTLHQDLALSYLLDNCHILIEPFQHNEMHNNLVIPPLDTMSSLMEYLNSVQVFYNTRYILFFDEPKVTYLISRSGTPTLMKGEEYSTVFLNMRSTTDSNNLTLGMNDNKDIQAYELDVSVLDSNYNIDKDTGKMVESIDAIVNPSLEKSIISGDIVSNLKNEIKGTMKNFLMESIMQALDNMNIGTKLSSMIHSFQHAVDAIQKVSTNLQARIGEAANQFASTATKAVASQVENVQSQCNKILQQLPATVTRSVGGSTITKSFMTNAQKSIQKSMLDSRFMAADIARTTQKEVKSDFSKSIEETASEEYKKDFVDNYISAVTYVNFQDVAGKTTDVINSLQTGVMKTIENFNSNVKSKMGEFDNFTKNTTELLGQVKNWKKMVMSQLASSNSGSGGGGGGGSSAATSAAGMLLKQIREQEKNLSTIVATSDEFGGIAKQKSTDAENANAYLENAANVFNSFLGSIQAGSEQDAKSQFISSLPTRIFGNTTLSTDQVIAQTMKGQGGCFGGGGNAGMANTWGDLAGMISGSLNFGDLSKLASNLLQFDLGDIGSLGLSHFNFDLNLEKSLAGSTIGKVVGTKLMKVKNDNPNMLKNVKAEIELAKNQLSVNKFGLDPDVFTPNKEYIIKNYNGHDNKDGKFILNKKVLVFVREDQKFKCNCQLFFSKAVV